MGLLDSGFTPGNCAALREKLSEVITKNINDYVLNYSIEITMSRTAMLIPGMLSVLIFFLFCLYICQTPLES